MDAKGAGRGLWGGAAAGPDLLGELTPGVGLDGHLWPLYGACPHLPGSEDSSEGHGSRSTWHLTTGRPPSSSPSWKQASEGVERGPLRGQPGGTGSGFPHTGHGAPGRLPSSPHAFRAVKHLGWGLRYPP